MRKSCLIYDFPLDPFKFHFTFDKCTIFAHFFLAWYSSLTRAKKEPRNRFQGINSASLCCPRAGTINIPTRFLAPIDCLKIPALLGLGRLLYTVQVLLTLHTKTFATNAGLLYIFLPWSCTCTVFFS
jgi:hypothetical protein